MCVNINNVKPEDMMKLTVLLKELNGENLAETESALGALLGFISMCIMAGEDIHLADKESMEELIRRGKENVERIQRGEVPKTDRDWAADGLGLTPEALEQAIQEAARNLQNGVVPPGAYTPQGGGHNTIQPVQPTKPDDDEPHGMYL